MFRAALAALVFLASHGAEAQLDRVTSREAASALRAALERGANTAVKRLGRADGFYGDPQLRIPLPESLQRAETMMRRFGMGRRADELVLAMNRAAETAVPEARRIFVEAARRMTVEDAKAILSGGDTAGTAYFRRTTEEALRSRFLPIVQQATAKVGLAAYYARYAETGAALGLVRKEDANLDAYVTQKALDGLFFVVAQEETQIRNDPVGAGSALIRKVFGAL